MASTSGGTLRNSSSKAPSKRHRPFVEAGVFSKQSLVLDEREAVLASARSCGIQDARSALFAIENDIRLAKLRLVIGEVFHGELFWRHEAMAASCLAALDAIHLEIHDLAAKEAEDGM